MIDSENKSPVEKKVAIVVVAYNHAATLASTLDRIPADVWDRIEEVVVLDDASSDETYLVGKGYQSDRGTDKLTIIKNKKNLKYGGNQKKGYLYCINKGYDVAVLLHGDGQYAPEIIWDLIEPVVNGEVEACFGSRMMKPKEARRGGMPLYKYLGNKILTSLENRLLGSNLTEFHSGFRAYDLHALEGLPFTGNTDDFHFDTEIIIQLMEKGLRIKEVPIPTYYGDEICYVNGMKYAWNVMKATLSYWTWSHGLTVDPRFEVHSGKDVYNAKTNRYSSHRIITRACPVGKVLDVGCGSGQIGDRLGAKGCEVTGVDANAHAPEGYADYFSWNLDDGLPEGLDLKRYDAVVLADILEHLKDPGEFLKRVSDGIRDDAPVIVSVPNVAIWYVRLSLLFGFFPYAGKGVLDKTHLRFFTLGSLRKLCSENNMRVLDVHVSVFPFEEIFHGTKEKIISALYYALARVFKGFLAYQIIFTLEKDQDYEPPKANPADKVQA